VFRLRLSTRLQAPGLVVLASSMPRVPMATQLHLQVLKLHPVVASLRSDQKSGTKCVEITTKKVSFILYKSHCSRVCTNTNNQILVERRRRETINEGINEIAKIVPGCEKNKGSILARAVQFITQLKDNETQNIEKWTLEKLLTEQAIAELSSSCDKLKNECQRARAECEQWKKAAQNAGISSVEGVVVGAGTNAGAAGDAKEPISAPAPNTVGAAVAATAANEDAE